MQPSEIQRALGNKKKLVTEMENSVGKLEAKN
jgi:hypothetical protein